MKYRLRYQQHDFELAEGQFMIGRSTDCQLSLDDPLVSRNHAKLTVYTDKVTVEDLGSRNGVRVNGDRIDHVHALEHGDRLTIGTQDMVILRKREAKTDTMVQPPTHRAESFGLLSVLADKAIALGHADEAERILEPFFNQVVTDAESGREQPADLPERAADYAVKLASLTGKGAWLDYVFRLFSALGRPCPAPIVDGLYGALRKAKGVDRTLLRAYSGLLRQNAANMNPTERFLLSRIEGLERQVGLK
jgi:hypothetical protein